MYVIVGILVVLLIIFCLYIIGRDARRSAASNSLDVNRNPEEYFLGMCGGDAEKAEKLISMEIELRPRIGRRQAIKNAVYRMKNNKQ